MKKITLIVLLTAVYCFGKAQTRRVYIKEPITCYTDKELQHAGILIIYNDSITITKYKDDYWSTWRTVYKGDTVYVDEFELEDIKKERLRLERVQERKDSLVRRKHLIAKYGLRLGRYISDRNIRIGMTKAMALDAWGKPNEIHRTVFATHSHEQWVYNDGQYLYFDNGILTSWQD